MLTFILFGGKMKQTGFHCKKEPDGAMYKVVIAEDELLVRMGIVASVPWEELSLQVAASVADGE